MPSRRDREREREQRSRSPDRDDDLPEGVSPISESDYFLKNSEFGTWLRDEKGKYFDELSGERARSYFRKFVKAWNRGRLPKSLYNDPGSLPATKQTGYKWSFASRSSGVDAEALRSAREDVDSATYGPSRRSRGGPGETSGSVRTLGPALPSASDLVLAREVASEYQAAERDLKRKRDRAEAKDRVEDVVGPKEVGREAMLEKKRARRENDKAFREKGDEGLEADESTLLGGGDSFKDHIARREAARRRWEGKRAAGREDKEAAGRERAIAMREKEKETMDMFQKLAKERFG
ncbi:hypothetical protein PISMIDRAFT_648142 [Pisolithus microcarpus 441]|uniref:Uncharacterized protein n=1 Tax=Pisolithus microcarpus 441 TaxID=765257 RepID=A0A0C9YXM2_9AGAM|nr:hypothetical protein BKA83DRAFT_648142 [Pisolithus microcarpus]KIK29870.1 hypothetical protein PISMIDRAFT_648142 [Pisolithus microcarpus 441]